MKEGLFFLDLRSVLLTVDLSCTNRSDRCERQFLRGRTYAAERCPGSNKLRLRTNRNPAFHLSAIGINLHITVLIKPSRANKQIEVGTELGKFTRLRIRINDDRLHHTAILGNEAGKKNRLRNLTGFIRNSQPISGNLLFLTVIHHRTI